MNLTKLSIVGKVTKEHTEGDVRVIDEVKVDHVSITPRHDREGYNRWQFHPALSKTLGKYFRGKPSKPEQPKITLTEKDIGRWVTYNNGFKEEKGKIKSFDNERQVAWVVYNCNENWDCDHWKDYTAACTNYSDLDL